MNPPTNDVLLDASHPRGVPIVPVREGAELGESDIEDARARRWLEASGFRTKRGACCLVPDRDGGLSCVVTSTPRPAGPFAIAHLPAHLPAGTYHLQARWTSEELENASLGFALACYRFDRYKQRERPEARLAVDPACRMERVRNLTASIHLVRDLINTPAQDMMPADLSRAVQALASEAGTSFSEIVGDDLLREGFPAVHAVGRASAHPPRVIELGWGDPAHPELVLAGKGVCFDSGGLDLKSAQYMRLMKKDMGGAAHAIGLARLVMREGLPVRLRLMVAAVENAVSANAYRPGDIIRARNGMSIEIDNTDAEGRVILSDVLAAASAGQPALILDFATLTGAARIALGPDLPALFCNDDEVSEHLASASRETQDPLWRLPLHQEYEEFIDTPVADVANAGSTPLAGAITAALFLQRFVAGGVPWAHFDLMAWNTRSRPGRPEGGEAMGLRAVHRYLEERWPRAT